MADQSPFSLEGKTVIQFGGTGLLGRALVTGLARAGARLIVASRNRTALEEVLTAERVTGGKVDVDEVDVCSEDSVKGLRDRVLAAQGRVDGIVFNVVSRPMRGMGDPLKAWKESMETNATGMFNTLRTFGDAMAQKKSGSIVNIASIQGMVGANPWLYEGTSATTLPDYFFHKGGMINLTRYFAAHYGPHGVRVNVVSPGGIYNPVKPQAPSFIERYSKMTMLGRMAKPEDISGAVVFLLSDASEYVTGANIPVDAGYTAK